jgi:hypothetical protein
MGDWASAGPMATSEENLGSDDDSVTHKVQTMFAGRKHDDVNDDDHDDDDNTHR